MITDIMIAYGVFFGFAVITLIVLLSKSMYLVRQAETIIIERLGKYDRILGPGFHIVIPFLDTPRTVLWTYTKEMDNKRHYSFTKIFGRIDLREAVYDFPRQNVITKDNVTMEINALLYYQITDPKLAVYEINNLPQAIEQLTQTTLRDVIGSLDLDESLVSRNQINERLRLILDEATDKWGVKVNRVELKEVNPPADIRHAMEKQMRAERDKRATILESEGKKQAAILEAQGESEARIMRAQGESQARLKIAEAESEAIKMIQHAVPGADPLPYMMASKYIEVLPEMTKGKNDKMILVPYEASALIGSLSSMKKIFNEIK